MNDGCMMTLNYQVRDAFVVRDLGERIGKIVNGRRKKLGDAKRKGKDMDVSCRICFYDVRKDVGRFSYAAEEKR